MRWIVDGAVVNPLGCLIYSEYFTVRTVADGARCYRETLSGSGSLKNKVFQTAYFSDWKVEFTVVFALIRCPAPTEGVA
jgi:hypothetical protein